jgi:hypothetical protein
MERRRLEHWAATLAAAHCPVGGGKRGDGGGRRGAGDVPGGRLRTADGGSRRGRESSARSAAEGACCGWKPGTRLGVTKGPLRPTNT